jgi:hypothetical protein
MLAGIVAREHRLRSAMRASMIRLSVRFPVALDAGSANAALEGLAGLDSTDEIVLEVAAREALVSHALWVPARLEPAARSKLTGAIPSIRIRRQDFLDDDDAAVNVRVFVPTPTLLSIENVEAKSRALLAALATLRGGEQVIVRWCLRPGDARDWRQPRDLSGRALEVARAWQKKAVLPGFTVAGRISIKASSDRALELAEHVQAVLRGNRGSTAGVQFRRERGSLKLGTLPRTGRRSGFLSTREVIVVAGMPIGPYAVAGVEVGTSRELLVPPYVPKTGRGLFIGRSISGEHPVALDADAARQHLGIVGPTGSGKSTVVARAILADLSRGGGVSVDPRDDTNQDVLNRVTPRDVDRVVVLEPAVEGRVAGLRLFGAGDPDVRTDVILSVLRGLSESWGPRLDQYMRLGLRTVAELPDPVLSDWLRLYSEPRLRRSAVARLRDPVLIAQWRAYEALSPAEQFQHVAPAVSRISALLSRPALRNVLNQPNPKIDVDRLLREGKFLFVSLSPGTLGEPAARLLGAIVTYLVWAAVEARVTLAPEHRKPVFLYFDELQSVSALPGGLERFFERTRGLGCGVVVATQTLGRLPEGMRQSLLGNVGSLITFRAGSEEATRIARELPGLSAEDIQGLARFEVAARINTAGAGTGSAVVTGRTEPLPPPVLGQAAAIRARSAARYGVDVSEIEAELTRRIEDDGQDDEPLGRVRRAG